MAKVRKQYIDPKHNFFKTVPMILLIMTASGLLLLTLSALFAYRSQSPLKLADLLPPVCLFISSVIGGYVSGRTTERPVSYLSALTASTVLALIMVLLRTFVPAPENTLKPSISFLFHSLIIISSLLGVLISERTHTARKSKRKRSRRSK